MEPATRRQPQTRIVLQGILLACLLAGCGGGGGGGAEPGSSSDTSPPTVVSTVPAGAATGVDVAARVQAVFSESMNAASIGPATFHLSGGGGPVAGSVTYDAGSRTATFTPIAPLAHATAYTATITTGARDAAGNGCAYDHVWTFTTAPDIASPSVVSTIPAADATAVPVNRSVTATFSEPMDEATIDESTFTLSGGGGPVAGSVAYDMGLRTAIFTPTAPLAYATAYTATITTGARDAAGNGLAAAHTWRFTTGPVLDTTPPAVVSTIPAADATGVPIDAVASATFSEPVDPSTVGTATVTLTRSGVPVTGNLCYGSTYVATVTSGIRDLAGNSMASSFSWQFTTVPAPTSAPLQGILVSSGVCTVFYDSPTRTATLLLSPAVPLVNAEVRAIVPTSTENTGVAWEDVASSSASGLFSFPIAQGGRTLLVAEKHFPSGAVLRILGVGRINNAGGPQYLEMAVQDVTPTTAESRLDTFCTECHPPVPTPGQITRCLHPSGIVPVKAYKPTGPYDAFGRVTCESCHSPHRPSGILHFANASYLSGELCLRCHD